MRIQFDQYAFMIEVFDFIHDNNIKIRDFCARAGCSLPTIYRARDKADTSRLTFRTIEKIQCAVDRFKEEIVTEMLNN